MAYYRALFSGELGFELVRAFVNSVRGSGVRRQAAGWVIRLRQRLSCVPGGAVRDIRAWQDKSHRITLINDKNERPWDTRAWGLRRRQVMFVSSV